MEYFIRPSKAELIKTNNEIKTIRQFMELIDERVKLLTQEKLKLEDIIRTKKLNLEKYKAELEDKSEDVLKKYGYLGLKRISHFTKRSFKINLKYEFIAGIKYFFPEIVKGNAVPYALSITSFEIDDLYNATMKFMENIIDLSRYIEAEKKITHELNLIRRKLNALKNLIIPELETNRKKIKKFLAEKERFDNVGKINIIEMVKD
ncbi:hypothetical protein JXB41_03940 [Candidatus Woesearchaeota archaeon]|nr:hypothetical protein [Candidatus Woesearchaeota archaeon]